MKRMFTPLALVAALLSLFAFVFAPAPFAKAQDETGALATVRFVHVYSGGGPVDIYVDGTKLVSQLAFGTATEYASLPAGDRQIQVVATGQQPDTALIDKKMGVDEGKAYEVLISGQGDKLDARSKEVNLDSLDAGNARLRFIQGEPGASDLDIALTVPGAGADTTSADEGDLPVFKKISDDSDYQDITAGTYGLVATNSDDDTAKVNLPDITLSAGNVYDVIILGQIDSNNLTLLPLITPVSGPCSGVLGVGDSGTDACVRFAHVSPDAGPVDVYVDGQAVAQNISYGTATDFVTVSDSDHQIQVVPTGKTTDDALLDDSFGFGTGQAYQISVLGLHADDNISGDDLSLKRNDVDLATLPPQQFRVRFIQAIPEQKNVTVESGDGTKLLDNADFGDASDYTVVNAGTLDLSVTDKDGNSLIDAKGQEFQEGITYDVFIVGQQSDPSTLQLFIVQTATEVRTGAQGTPVTVPTAATSGETPVGAATSTVVGGGSEPTATEVGASDVTPVLTEEPSVTPTT
jgi:hypothetical protein